MQVMKNILCLGGKKMRNNGLPSWKEKTLFEKGLTISGIFISIIILILTSSSLIGEWKNVINIDQPLIGILLLIQWLQWRKYNKTVSVFSLLVAVYIFCVAIRRFFF